MNVKNVDQFERIQKETALDQSRYLPDIRLEGLWENII